jgi:hypothetical protein
MGKRINALILDDNEIIGENIKKRIFKASATNFPFFKIEVVPYFITINISNIRDSALKISHFINSKEIDYLLLDRGFYHVIDPKLNHSYSNLNDKYLYTKKVDLQSGIKIETILELIPKNDLKRIKGIIVYTYDTTGDYIEPAQIKQLYLDIFPKRITENAIEIILTNSEIYNLAGLDLYIDKELPDDNELTMTGLKSDFKLYGLFMGEILYHRVIALINKTKQKSVSTKRKFLIRSFIILFFTFTGLTIGGNALYEILDKKIKNDAFLLLSSIVFSLLVPLFILAVRPDLLMDVDNEE